MNKHRYEVFVDKLDGTTEVRTYSTDLIDMREAAAECERRERVVVLEIKRLA